MDTSNSKLSFLYNEYKSKFQSVINKFPNVDIAGPLLMSINDNYFKQKKKLLIIGQETNGWGYHSNDINSGMKHYEDFNLGI